MYRLPTASFKSRIADFLRSLKQARWKAQVKHFVPSPTGGNKYVRKSALALEVTALRAIISEMRDELQRSEAREKRARYLALHDDLTSLPNRRYFMDCLSAALMRQRGTAGKLAIIYLDLDDFKTLNDAHGHDAGDQILKIVAARLSHAVRAEDIVSRLGGDEYACLVTSAPNARDVQRVASSLQRAASAPLKVGSKVVSIRSSIGFSIYPSDGATAASLIKAADVAMFAAKRERRGIPLQVH